MPSKTTTIQIPWLRSISGRTSPRTLNLSVTSLILSASRRFLSSLSRISPHRPLLSQSFRRKCQWPELRPPKITNFWQPFTIGSSILWTSQRSSQRLLSFSYPSCTPSSLSGNTVPTTTLQLASSFSSARSATLSSTNAALKLMERASSSSSRMMQQLRPTPS